MSSPLDGNGVAAAALEEGDGWFKLSGDARLGACATEGCGGQPTWRFEAGGVGSNYCSGCGAAIRSLRTSPPASPTEAGEATTSLPDPALTDAIEWLETNQRQLDQDGIEVAVSRQALEQVLAALKDRSHV